MGASAQTVNLGDSLKHVLSFRPVPTAKMDTRNAFIGGRSARMQGVKVGLVFRKSLTIGIGYNWLASDITRWVPEGDGTIEARIGMRYIAPFAEYIFYRKNNWEATVPLQVGIGKSFLAYDRGSDRVKVQKGTVVLYEPAMIVEYKVMKLLGVGGGIGYRLMLRNNSELDEQFTSPVYLLRVRLIFDEWKRLGERWAGRED